MMILVKDVRQVKAFFLLIYQSQQPCLVEQGQFVREERVGFKPIVYGHLGVNLPPSARWMTSLHVLLFSPRSSSPFHRPQQPQNTYQPSDDAIVIVLLSQATPISEGHRLSVRGRPFSSLSYRLTQVSINRYISMQLIKTTQTSAASTAPTQQLSENHSLLPTGTQLARMNGLGHHNRRPPRPSVLI